MEKKIISFEYNLYLVSTPSTEINLVSTLSTEINLVSALYLLKLSAGKDEMCISWEENNMHTEAIDLSSRGQ